MPLRKRGIWIELMLGCTHSGTSFGRILMRRAASKTKASLPTAEARRQLPSLVKEMGAKQKPSKSLLNDAVDIGPHRKGGAILIPEIDVAYNERELEQLRDRIEQLEDELEDLGLALFIEERLASSAGKRLTAQEFLAGIGMEDFVAKLPGA